MNLPRSAVLPLLLGCALSGCGEPAAQSPGDVSTTPARVPVTLYLGDGSDISGLIERVTRTHITLDTTPEVEGDAPEQVRRKRVQGLILDTDAEREVAGKLTTDPMLWIAAGRYVWSSRQDIARNIPPVPCGSEAIPLLHAQLNREGEITDARLLASSGCEELDRAVIEGFFRTRLAPLPKEYPFKMYPMNYFHQPEAAEASTSGDDIG